MLHSWAAVVVPVRLGLLLRWLGMIVVVPDGNPVQTLLKLDCFVGWGLQACWDDFVHNAVGIIGTQYPDLCLAKYSCLRSSDAWLDDGIFGHTQRTPALRNCSCSIEPASTPELTVPVSTAGAVAQFVVKNGRLQIRGRQNRCRHHIRGQGHSCRLHCPRP